MSVPDAVRHARDLANRADQDPAAVADSVDEIVSLLTASEEDARNFAAYTLATLAQTRPEAVTPVAEELLAALDDVEPVRRNAAAALSTIAPEYPEAVDSGATRLVQALDAPDTETRRSALVALVGVTNEHPESGRPAVERCIDFLGSPDDSTRSHAAYVLGNVAEIAPEAVRPAVEHLQGLADDESEYARNNAVVALLCVAQEYPGSVKPALASVSRLLEDPDRNTRKHAVRLFGQLSDAYPSQVAEVSAALVRRAGDHALGVRESALRTIIQLSLTVPNAVTPLEDAIRQLRAGMADDFVTVDAELMHAAIGQLEAADPDAGRAARRAVDSTDASAAEDQIPEVEPTAVDATTEVDPSVDDGADRKGTPSTSTSETSVSGSQPDSSTKGHGGTAPTRTPPGAVEATELENEGEPKARPAGRSPGDDSGTEVFGDPADTAEHVAFCRHCGTDLRSRSVGSFCPSCGSGL